MARAAPAGAAWPRAHRYPAPCQPHGRGAQRSQRSWPGPEGGVSGGAEGEVKGGAEGEVKGGSEGGAAGGRPGG